MVLSALLCDQGTDQRDRPGTRNVYMGLVGKRLQSALSCHGIALLWNVSIPRNETNERPLFT
jgi:hypothetical protein